MYTDVLKSANSIIGNRITEYRIDKNENGFFIESEIPGSSFFCRVFLGNCGEEKAEKTAAFLAEKAVHPVHTEDIICDMVF